MHFGSTMWRRIDEAKAGSMEAISAILNRYRAPLLDYVRSRGLNDHDAEDVVQEVCLEIIRDDFIRRADQAKGRFRTLLLRVTQHVLASHFRREYAEKRGGGRKALSLEELDETVVPGEDEDRFNQLWVKNLVGMALQRLRSESADLKVPYDRVLEMRFLEGRSGPEIAEKLDCKPHDVENYVYLGKQRLKKYLEELTRELASSEEEEVEETRILGRYGL